MKHSSFLLAIFIIAILSFIFQIIYLKYILSSCAEVDSDNSDGDSNGNSKRNGNGDGPTRKRYNESIQTLPSNFAVVYSGPTTNFASFGSLASATDKRSINNTGRLLSPSYQGKTHGDNLYDTNFRHFLRHGLPSSYHDCMQNVTVIIVLTKETARHYNDLLTSANATCGDIEVIVRENKCLDMESARLGFERVDWHKHKKVVFLNCGMLGPIIHPPAKKDVVDVDKYANANTNVAEYWAVRYMRHVNNENKIVGITANCGGKSGVRHAHIQSMIYSTDEIGYRVMVNQSAIYDCREKLSSRPEIIVNYELGLSRAVMKAGYSITALFDHTLHNKNHNKILELDDSNFDSNTNFNFQVLKFDWNSAPKAKCNDPWYRGVIDAFFTPYDLGFFKVTRFIPEGLSKMVEDMDDAMQKIT